MFKITQKYIHTLNYAIYGFTVTEKEVVSKKKQYNFRKEKKTIITGFEVHIK